MDKIAKANVEPVRQRTQYSCMAASMTMCLRALDHDVTEDEVNAVMGARPMKGAAWEQALACAQHYGCRATLTMPATVEQLKEWTDAGVPIMIAWNPEGRPWSHASVVFDVDDDLNVFVADPNMPNPKKTVRVVPEDEFYGKWYEKFPDYLVRRPACAIAREITEAGTQVRVAAVHEQSRPNDSTLYRVTRKGEHWPFILKTRGPNNRWYINFQADLDFIVTWLKVEGIDPRKVALVDKANPKQKTLSRQARAERRKKPQSQKTRMKAPKGEVKRRNTVQQQVREQGGMGGAGAHKNRTRSVEKGHSRKPKHRKPLQAAIERVANGFLRMAVADEALMDRAAGLLQHMDEKKAVAHLVKEGESRADAFLAAKAGSMLNKDRMQRMRRRADLGTSPDWKGAAKKLLARAKGTSQRDLHYRAYLRAILSNNESQATHLTKKFDGARDARDDLIDMAGKQAAYSGNPDGKPIYDVDIDHGEFQPLAGGTDVMKRLQDEYRIEQGGEVRAPQPRLAATKSVTVSTGWGPGYALWADRPGGKKLGHAPTVNKLAAALRKALGAPADPPQSVVARAAQKAEYDTNASVTFDGRRWDVGEGMSRKAVEQVALRFLAAQVRSARAGATLDRGVRQKANAKLSRAGLDGNGRFRKPEMAYSKALTVLSEFGIELGEVVSSHLFQARPSGTLNVDLAFSNPEDSFSPAAITNSVLHLQFTELRKDHFEAVAYLS